MATAPKTEEASNLCCIDPQNNFDSDDSDAFKGHSQTETAAKSKIEREGARYYPVEPGYDKRVYENTCENYCRIFLTLCGFWIFNSLHWWGVFEFGIMYSAQFTLYSIAIFVAACSVGACMLMSGAGTNKTKRRYEFLRAKVFECKAIDTENDEKRKQKKEYDATKKAEKLAQEKRDMVEE